MHVTLAFLTISAALGFQDPPRTVEGVAVFSGTDRPAARMTLHVFDQRDPACKVVTDDQGRFQAKVPVGQEGAREDGRREERCWAEAEGPGRWTVEPINTSLMRQPRNSIQDYVDQALARPVKSATWERGRLRVEITEPGEVAILVRGPDGSPVTDQPVQVTPNWPPGEMLGPTSARFQGRTDAEGRFRIRWFPSIRQFRVAVPELGFASTQSIDIKAGATATGETRPLARFGSISGTTTVKLANAEIGMRQGFEELDPVAIDKTGRFEVRDVPPGHYTVRVREPNGSKIRSDQVNVWVAPGGRVEGLVINELPPLSPEAAESSRKSEARTMARLNGKEGEEVWVEGTVRDTAGKPLPKAEVIVRTAYHGGMRMYEDVRSTTTDAAGHYSISGPIRGFVETLVVVALVKGHPPAVGNAPARSGDHDKASKLDLTIASVGGSATISVFNDGKPELFCNVRLEGEGSANFLAGFGWAYGTQGPAKSALEAIAWPSANTDRNGVATFDNLIPGVYTVHATNGPDQPRGQRRGIRENGEASGEAHGLRVVAGRDGKISLAIASVNHTVKFQVFRPNGQPVTDQTVGFSFGLGGTTSSGSMLKLDGQGVDDFTFSSAGLWTVVVRFRDTPVNSFPIAEPCYEARALVPVSIGAPITEPIKMVGAQLEIGSLRVRLLDDEGKPGRGAVVFPSQIRRESPAASVDSRGEILFENVGNGEQWVSGSIEGPAPPSWSVSRRPRRQGRHPPGSRDSRRAESPARRLHPGQVHSRPWASRGGVQRPPVLRPPDPPAFLAARRRDRRISGWPVCRRPANLAFLATHSRRAPTKLRQSGGRGRRGRGGSCGSEARRARAPEFA
jgi:protocatechuate 3,4-dioxygenase beta subunit